MALQKGFRIKMPYADRLDRHNTRTINFYCHMSKSANRKLSASNQEGCPFRAIYKLKSLKSLKEECRDEADGFSRVDLFELYKLEPCHNHRLSSTANTSSCSNSHPSHETGRDTRGGEEEDSGLIKIGIKY